MSRLRLHLLPVLVASTAALALASPARAATGTFTALSYNVAGLPAILSSGNPAANTTAIGVQTSRFDVVNVQEDFNYHATLYKADHHPFRTPTSGGVPFGSGLNTMSNLPLSGLRRKTWRRCYSVDCLSPKGYTFARLALPSGATIDLYNAHTQAQTTLYDLRARRSNVEQLAEAIRENSAGHAVLVMGDTNTRYSRAADNIRVLAERNGLTDAWVATQRAGVPPAAGSPALVCDKAVADETCEVVDKIMFRSGGGVDLRLDAFRREHEDFLDARGRPLSDHAPISARFTWSTAG